MRVRWLVALVGCEQDLGYCIAEVSAEDQGQGISDPVWYNPKAVGTTICGGYDVSAGFCRKKDGIFGNTEIYQSGARKFCEENGFTVDCSPEVEFTSNIDHVTVWVEPGTECPEGPSFFTTTAAESASGT